MLGIAKVKVSILLWRPLGVQPLDLFTPAGPEVGEQFSQGPSSPTCLLGLWYLHFCYCSDEGLLCGPCPSPTAGLQGEKGRTSRLLRGIQPLHSPGAKASGP